ncbi:hypothetical protein Poli38472_004741 [Pythium oligandrum]|uniref:Uncharacterized protein n=1 Tax=Pythium oligandrum TaxID=41045 RepID=A0A8K1FHE9_PYTOL|nr:hypothetical protein Poli38472_004741 [Pythium oligandrum]|eukprot:TMW59672.1 hypothetical protein Poli38472_004741 [Pythium oligandrum]
MTKDSPRDDSGASGVWTSKEHERFLEGMAMYPRGPWRAIADHVGTRSLKQVQTHAQKYQQKLLRHQRGLRKNKLQPSRMEHRVDEMTVDQFTKGAIMRKARPVCWPRHNRLSPYVLKHVEPVPFHEPQEPTDWNLHEVQLLLETLDVTMC